MSKLVSTAKQDLQGMLHGTTLNKVTNVNQLLGRAARNMLAQSSPPEAIRFQQITNAVHDDIYDYSAPDDMMGTRLTDIRPQVNRTEADSVRVRSPLTFDKYKLAETATVRYNKGVKTLRFSTDISGSPITLHSCNSLTANGTWSASTSATNLTKDENNYFSGSASLNFDMSGSSVNGYLTNSDMEAVDLSDEEDIGKLWVRFYIPDTSIVSSLELRWGSSASAYWYNSVTSPHDQSSFKTGWNILGFDWNGATQVGSPDSSAVDYLRLKLVQSSATAETDYRVDKITCSAGTIYEIGYYSECLFEDSEGNRIAEPTSDNDYLMLDEDGYLIFLWESVKAIAQQTQGEDAGFDWSTAEGELYGDGRKAGLYDSYNADHPDQTLRVQEIYYDIGLY